MCPYVVVSLDRYYKHGQQIPKAQPWIQLAHDKRALQGDIKGTLRNIHVAPDRSICKPILKRALKKLRGKANYIQKQKTRQCDFVDHVIEQMAGGEAFLEDFLRYLLTKGPSSEKYCQLLPELNGIDRQKLLGKAREVHHASTNINTHL